MALDPTSAESQPPWAGASVVRRQAGAISLWIGRSLVDLAFPPCCLACRRSIGENGALCPACWRQMRFIEQPLCDRLGTPFPTDLGAPDVVSPEAIANPPVFGRARAVARFEDGPARQLVHRLKYGDRLELARTMGRWMARAGTEILVDADVLVPVPLHRTRLAVRRFNQSAALAAAVSAACGVPVNVDALDRAKRTRAQVGLSRTQRALNMQGAFKVDGERRLAVESRAVILIDDVLTSGATLNAAARTLLRAGARRVDALVFARVVTGT